jgi:small ligand-binding sensory domain FIST
MNSLRSILHGIQSVNHSGVPIFGAGILGDFDFAPSSLFCSNGIRANCIMGITFCGDFDIDYIVMHGCMPINGIYHTITKNEGPLILELDGRPAIEIVNDIYGNRDWQKEIPVKELTIGVNMGPKYGPYKESNYVNRLIASPDLLKKGILTPEPDWQPGTEIQFMIRDNEDMLKSTQLSVETLVEQNINAGKKPLLGFFIDCAGRTSYFSNSLHEEAELVQRVFNQHNVPLFGFYSGLEIAPFFNESRGLEWTGVLVLLVEK